jgi:hypothetical protein
MLVLTRFGLTRVGCNHTCQILRASHILCFVAIQMTLLLENYYFSELNTLCSLLLPADLKQLIGWTFFF